MGGGDATVGEGVGDGDGGGGINAGGLLEGGGGSISPKATGVSSAALQHSPLRKASLNSPHVEVAARAAFTRSRVSASASRIIVSFVCALG
eukprot:scaffold136514_cov26-Tisochrysis_lutea.AAC.1